MERRRLLSTAWRWVKGAVAGSLALTGLPWIKRAVGGVVVAPTGQAPTRPPGAVSEAALRAACTRCYLCGQVCPLGAIRFPNRIEGAQSGLRGPPPPVWIGDQTPYVLPWGTACNMCLACTEVCPTGALVPLMDKTQIRMGVARVDRKVCLPWTRTSWCGACHQVCPLKNDAITVDYRNRPAVNPDHCTGCGLCVEVCPLKYKAIAIEVPFTPDRGAVRAE